MRLLVVPIALALVAAGCGQDDEQAAAPTPGTYSFAELTVTVDRDGTGGTGAKTVRVRCGPASDSQECAALADMKASTFKPTPPTMACTELYGGPQVATVKGRLRGKPVNARFSRTNGCEIARWNKASKLLEAVG
jgi:hypothetical protein